MKLSVSPSPSFIFVDVPLAIARERGNEGIFPIGDLRRFRCSCRRRRTAGAWGYVPGFMFRQEKSIGRRDGGGTVLATLATFPPHFCDTDFSNYSMDLHPSRAEVR